MKKKEIELEEDALVEYFKNIYKDKFSIDVEMIENNYLRKKIHVNDKHFDIKTLQLGLFKTFGGRLTLVDDVQNKYLVFCGIPNEKQFAGTKLGESFYKMQLRKGVLTRDWSIASTKISLDVFEKLQKLSLEKKDKLIEKYLLENFDIAKSLMHHGTFLINNPVKKDADKFIKRM